MSHDYHMQGLLHQLQQQCSLMLGFGQWLPFILQGPPGPRGFPGQRGTTGAPVSSLCVLIRGIILFWLKILQQTVQK